MNSLMSDVVETSSSYLYPCTIEYSLICAGKYKIRNVKQMKEKVESSPKEVHTRAFKKTRIFKMK